MKKIILSLIAIVIIAASCTKSVDKPLVKKNPQLVMRKRPRDPSLPPTPYILK